MQPQTTIQAGKPRERGSSWGQAEPGTKRFKQGWRGFGVEIDLTAVRHQEFNSLNFWSLAGTRRAAARERIFVGEVLDRMAKDFERASFLKRKSSGADGRRRKCPHSGAGWSGNECQASSWGGERQWRLLHKFPLTAYRHKTLDFQVTNVLTGRIAQDPTLDRVLLRTAFQVGLLVAASLASHPSHSGTALTFSGVSIRLAAKKRGKIPRRSNRVQVTGVLELDAMRLKT